VNIFKKIEQSLERIIEDRLAGAFTGEVHPIEIARRMQQKMRQGRKVGPGKMYAPNFFEIALNPDDLKPLEEMGAVFRTELIAYLKEQAREDDLVFLSAPAVSLISSIDISRGRVEVRASFREDSTRESIPAGGVLVGVEGFDKGREFSIELPCATFGRGEGNTHILGDPKASRRHFSISFHKDHFAVRDVGSRNGTTLNGKALKEERLKSGDLIGVGYSVYEFKVVEV
jgi:hypothetical protein